MDPIAVRVDWDAAEGSIWGREGPQPYHWECSDASQAGHEELALEDQVLGQELVEVHEQLVLLQDLPLPLVGIHGLQLLEGLPSESDQAFGVEILEAGNPAQRRLMGSGPASTSSDDPLLIY